MTWSFRIARIAGIDVRVHATFLLIVLLGAGQWGRGHGAAGALFGALLIVLLFVCVTLHELGHSLVARHFGVEVTEIVLLPIGGVSRMRRMPRRARDELLVSLAGPLVNVAIAALLFAISSGMLPSDAATGRPMLAEHPTAPSRQALVGWLFTANVVLAVFNLLPAFPMDGGRVLRALLTMAIGRKRATRAAAVIGQTLATGLGLVGIMSGNLVLAFVALFVFLGATQEQMEDTASDVLRTLRVGDAYNEYALTLAPGDHVSNVVELLLKSYQPDFAVMQGSEPIGVLSRDDALRALASDTRDLYVAGIMHRDFLHVQADASLDDVRRRMAEEGRRLAAVYAGERYLGLVSAEDIAEALLVASFVQRQADARLAEAQGRG